MMVLNVLSDTISWEERLNYMGSGVLLGVVVVFSVLALLWLILEIFGAISRRGKAAPVSPKTQEPAPTVVTAPVVPAAPAAPVATNDDEIVAAITAALAVYLEEANASSPTINGFRVVSFKKVGTAAHWNQN